MKLRCTGTTRSGKQCNKPPIKGGTVCVLHGGGAPQVRAAANRRIEEAKAREDVRRSVLALGEPVEVDPMVALLKLIKWKYGEVIWLRGKVQSLDDAELTWGLKSHEVGMTAEGPIDKQTFDASQNIWWRLLRDAENQLADWCAKATRAGVEAAQIQFMEQQAEALVDAIETILDRLVLSPEQLERVPQIVPQVLKGITA